MEDSTLKGIAVHRLLVAAVAIFALAVPPAALAQDPAQNAYGRDTEVLGEIGSVEETPARETTPTPAPAPTPTPSAPVAQAQPSGNLPFTGTDVALLALGGGLLLLLGLSLRRFSRNVA
jgi:hypothetical protein